MGCSSLVPFSLAVFLMFKGTVGYLSIVMFVATYILLNWLENCFDVITSDS